MLISDILSSNDRIVQLILDAVAKADSTNQPELANLLETFVDEDGELSNEPHDICSALDDFSYSSKQSWELLQKILKIMIEDGDANAMNNLGAMYYNGKGVEQSYELALKYYHMAAEHGSRQAQENLGYCYYYGRSVPVDYKKAFHYYALGAFDGHLTSLYKIGDMYANGYYVEKNEQEAFRIWDYCMAHMTDEAAPFAAGPIYLRLGKAFLNGTGTEQNLDAALVCSQKAEVFLYNMIRNGDKMYRGSMKAAIETQQKARELLHQELND